MRRRWNWPRSRSGSTPWSKGLSAPWFGLHLRRGNSLIGARRAVYTTQSGQRQIMAERRAARCPIGVTGERTSTPVTVGGELERRHPPLPASGRTGGAPRSRPRRRPPSHRRPPRRWKNVAPALSRPEPTKKQIDDLTELGPPRRGALAVRLPTIDDRRAADSPLHPGLGSRRTCPTGGAVKREQIEAALADADGAYRRLRLIMDAWCALWFWPLTEGSTSVVVTPTVPRCGLRHRRWISGSPDCRRCLDATPTLRKRVRAGQSDLRRDHRRRGTTLVMPNDLNSRRQVPLG